MTLDPPPAIPEETESIVGQLWARARQHPWQLVSAAGLLLAILAFLFELVHLLDVGNRLGDMSLNAFYGIWVVLWMMLVTMPLRTLRLRDVVRGWLLGFFAAMGLVVVIGAAITAIIPPGNLRTAFLIPILEEAVKALPLVAMIVAVMLGRARDPSITDLTILGYAVGAGFGFHEDGLWVRVVADGFGDSLWGLLFPSFLWEGTFVVAHGGWTALVGLGLGLAWHFRRHKLAWILAMVPLAVATIDHSAINYRGDGQGLLRALLLDGRLAGWVLLVGFVTAAAIDWWTLRGRLRQLDLPPQLTLGEIVRTVQGLPRLRTKAPGGVLLIAQRRVYNSLGYRSARGPTELIQAR